MSIELGDIDQSAPVTTLAYSNFTLTLAATDAGSGLAAANYADPLILFRIFQVCNYVM